MKRYIFIVAIIAAQTAKALALSIGLSSVSSAYSSDSQHAQNIDNGSGTNVYLSGVFSGSLQNMTWGNQLNDPWIINKAQDQFGTWHQALFATANLGGPGFPTTDNEIWIDNALMGYNGHAYEWFYFNSGDGLVHLLVDAKIEMNYKPLVGISQFDSDYGNFHSDGSGNVSAISFTGVGSGLTSLNGANIAAGTITSNQLDAATWKLATNTPATVLVTNYVPINLADNIYGSLPNDYNLCGGLMRAHGLQVNSGQGFDFTVSPVTIKTATNWTFQIDAFTVTNVAVQIGWNIILTTNNPALHGVTGLRILGANLSYTATEGTNVIACTFQTNLPPSVVTNIVSVVMVPSLNSAPTVYFMPSSGIYSHN